MFEIGSKLKEERLKQGLSLEAVSEKLRIRTSQLEKIENGSIDSFDNYFLKLFIRDYAKLLSLDSNVFVSEFEAFAGIEKAEVPETKKIKTKDNVKLPKKIKRDNTFYSSSGQSKKIVGIILFILALIAITVVVYVYARDYAASVSDIQPQEEIELVEVKDEVDEEEVVVVVEELPVRVLFVDQVRSEQWKTDVFNYTVENADELELKLEFFGESYVQVLDGDKEYLGKVMNNGQEYSLLSTSGEITMNLGAHQFVDIYIGDVKLEYNEWNKARMVLKITLSNEEN